MQQNKDIAILYGILAGDGCLSKAGNKYFISITGNFYDDKPFFDQIVIPTLNKIRKRETKYRDRQNHGKIEINFTDKDLFAIFSGLEFPVGRKGTKLVIPQELLENINYVVAGYFATDGSLVLANNNGTVYPRLEIQSLSKIMLEQVRDHLNSIGLNGSIYTIKREKFQVIYRLQFNGIDNLVKFERNIGFLNPKHKDKFERYMKRRGSSVVERHSFPKRAKLISVYEL